MDAVTVLALLGAFLLGMVLGMALLFVVAADIKRRGLQ
jgi:hypothetical protein